MSNRATIYLGETAEAYHVYAEIEITTGDDKNTTFTDHTTGPTPDRLSICFTLTTRRGNPATMADRSILSSGQVPHEWRVITKPATEHLELIEQAWAEHHLNDLNAACDHMTEEDLNPTAERLAEYSKANPRVAAYNLKQYYLLDTVTCAETGFKYGHAWLTKRLPADLLAKIRAVIAG